MECRDKKLKVAVKSWNLNDIAGLFGVAPDEVSEEVRELIASFDFRYTYLVGEEKEKVLLAVLKRIDSNELTVSGKHRKDDWERGWAENLDSFISNDSDLDKLTPKYLRPDQPVRFNQEYVLPYDAKFELNFYTVFRTWLYENYLKSAPAIYEFGCGTGYNLVLIAKRDSHKKLFGLDWSSSSVQLVDNIAKLHNYNMTGIKFDMFNPTEGIDVKADSIFLTMNSLEQLGSDHEKLIQFILKKKPSLCVHSEPLLELYDPDNLVDYLAVRYHKQRNYLDGYLTRLQELEREGVVRIVRVQRIPFGSLYHEGYSLLVWEPLGGVA
jgi:SAM-dependent methyltransferase